MKSVSRPLPDPLIELIAGRFRLLAHPVRLGLIHRLDRLGEAHVQALADELSATQQNTSKHLVALWRAGVLTRHHQGRVTVYALADREVMVLIEQVATGIAVQLLDRADDAGSTADT